MRPDEDKRLFQLPIDEATCNECMTLHYADDSVCDDCKINPLIKDFKGQFMKFINRELA